MVNRHCPARGLHSFNAWQHLNDGNDDVRVIQYLTYTVVCEIEVLSKQDIKFLDKWGRPTIVYSFRSVVKLNPTTTSNHRRVYASQNAWCFDTTRTASFELKEKKDPSVSGVAGLGPGDP